MKEIEPPLDEGEGRDLAIVKSVLGFVPIVGGALAELAGLQDPLAKRKEAFYQEVCDAINTLRSHYAITSGDLWANEAFVSCVVRAGQIALRNHRAEKLAALRNSLVSVATAAQADEDEAFHFLKHVDDLTVAQMLILRCVSENAEVFGQARSFQQAFESFTQLVETHVERITFRSYVNDLSSRGLLDAGDLEDFTEFDSGVIRMVADTSNRRPLSLTSIGHRFVAFISGDRP
jgi:hypothetical protein